MHISVILKRKGISMKTIKSVSIGIVLLVALAAVTAGMPVGRWEIAHAATLPPQAKQIPAALMVPAGNTFLFREFGTGTLGYNCPFTPASAEIPTILLHATSPTSPTIGIHVLNATGGLIWEALNGSTVLAAPIVKIPSPINPAVNSPWVLLQAQMNTGGAPFGQVTFIQRVFTMGAIPQTPCAANQTQVLVPFTTQYFFYGPTTATPA